MLRLAIESSTNYISLAVMENGALLGSWEAFSENDTSSKLLEIMEKHRILRYKFNEIIIGLGPGSYTGIRVGISAAHAIASVQGAQLKGLLSGYSIASKNLEVSRLGVFADAKRGKYYVTIFENGKLATSTYLID